MTNCGQDMPDMTATRGGGTFELVRYALSQLTAILLVGFFAGCSVDDIDTTYGKIRGQAGGASVNGTSVLAKMFSEAGHDVSTWRRLSPKLKQADTIVWAPDDFEPPTPEQREWLETWLGEEYHRTLIYIGRDYDAASVYWEKIQPGAPPHQATELKRRLASARAQHASERAQMPKQQYARWFTLRRDGQKRTVQTLEGPWVEQMLADGAPLNPAGAEIVIEARLDAPVEADIPKGEADELPDHQPLLTSAGDVLVARVTDDQWWRDGQVIVVVNGSFLLNLPLVNHEHRKLAGKLIEQCGDGEKVIFLESGRGGPPIHAKEPETQYPTGFEAAQIFPINAVVLHAIALGILICFALCPIFGRPRELEADPPSDFAKHLHALGELLHKTQDADYARARCQHYHEHVKRDSGVSHSEQRKRQRQAQQLPSRPPVQAMPAASPNTAQAATNTIMDSTR